MPQQCVRGLWIVSVDVIKTKLLYPSRLHDIQHRPVDLYHVGPLYRGQPSVTTKSADEMTVDRLSTTTCAHVQRGHCGG